MTSQPSDMTPDRKNRLAADCFKRGTEAGHKKNWDYAVSMLRQSVNLVPDNLLFRQTLRGSQEKKYSDNGKGAMMASMKLMPVRARIKKSKYNKDWAGVEQAAEDGLVINPWDAQLHADLGEAVRNLGFKEIAVFAYQRAVKNDKDNIDYLRILGALLEERGEYDSAVDCFRRVLQIDKLDATARTKITQLQAQSVLERGGYEGATQTRDVMADHEVERRLHLNKSADGPGVSQEADLQRAIRKDPANKDNYLKLADLYRRGGQQEKAEEQLKLAFDASGGDIAIGEQLEDIQLDRMRQAVQLSKEQYLKQPDNADLKQHYAQMATELIRREISTFAHRIARYPADAKLKFELAKRYMTTKKFTDAIPLLQQARSDNRIKGECLLQLGKCFLSTKEYSLAKRQLEQATLEIKSEDQPDLFKELYYYLGWVNERLKDAPSAINCYQEVLALDYTYKDTRERIQKLEQGEQT